MKQLLRHSAELLLFSNIWVAVTVGILVTGVAHYYHIEQHWLYGTFALLGTFTTYNFHRLVRNKTFQQAAITTPRSRWLDTHKSVIIAACICSTITAISLFFFLPLPFNSLFLLAGTGFIVLFYAIRIPFIEKSLREFSGLKNAWIVVVWAVLVAFPVINEQHSIHWIDLATIALLVYIQIIPFDIRDLKYDLPQMRTIPQLVGITAARLFGTLLICIFLLFLLFQHGFHWLALLVALTSFAGLWWKQRPSNLHYLEILWEGAIILLGIYFYVLPCLDS